VRDALQETVKAEVIIVLRVMYAVVVTGIPLEMAVVEAEVTDDEN